MAERRILQIMPGSGWAAVFDEGGEEVITPLVGWALVQDATAPPTVVGLVAWERVELAETQPNFSRYVFMSDMLFDGEADDYDDAEGADGDEPGYDPKSGRLN